MNAGEKISGFLNGFLSPLTSTATNLIGSTTTTTSTGDPNAASNSKTTILVISVLGVLVLVAIAYTLIKKSN
jgi:hypothetical protein